MNSCCSWCFARLEPKVTVNVKHVGHRVFHHNPKDRDTCYEKWLKREDARRNGCPTCGAIKLLLKG